MSNFVKFYSIPLSSYIVLLFFSLNLKFLSNLAVEMGFVTVIVNGYGDGGIFSF